MTTRITIANPRARTRAKAKPKAKKKKTAKKRAPARRAPARRRAPTRKRAPARRRAPASVGTPPSVVETTAGQSVELTPAAPSEVPIPVDLPAVVVDNAEEIAEPPATRTQRAKRAIAAWASTARSAARKYGVKVGGATLAAAASTAAGYALLQRIKRRGGGATATEIKALSRMGAIVLRSSSAPAVGALAKRNWLGNPGNPRRKGGSTMAARKTRKSGKRRAKRRVRVSFLAKRKNPGLPGALMTTGAVVAGMGAGALVSYGAGKIIEAGNITSTGGRVAVLIGAGALTSIGLGMFSGTMGTTAAVPVLGTALAVMTSPSSEPKQVAGLVDMRRPRIAGLVNINDPGDIARRRAGNSDEALATRLAGGR
jgi:hypothetical protein